MRKKRKRKPGGNPKGKSAPPYPFEFKLKLVRLHLEDGYGVPMLAQEFGVSEYSLYRWSRQYYERGEAGLVLKGRSKPASRLSESVHEKILEIKKAQPQSGSRRISDVLRRFFLIKASPSSVHKTLSKEGLTTPPKRKPQKNPAKPRFFERSRPNQLWQSDIMTFRLAGRNAYLIGFMDDYSRYITGLGFYRSQTAEHVLETYRRALSEYGVPKEVLTDNGRQYTNWRGTTRFERELKKDRVRHIKSRPHHPMTLGKIERFWKTIQNEYLQRAQFASFEDAVERTAFWIKYYNYKRPHQGIGGLCPADRFFEIQHALKKTLAQGVAENTLELALRGKPRDPFYMVGRMGEQSVVIRAEKGQVKMLVDDDEQPREKELVYDARKDIDDEESQESSQILCPTTENHGRVVGVDRAAHDGRDVPGVVGEPDAVQSMAEPSHGGYANGPGPEAPSATAPTECPSDPSDREEPAGPEREAAEASEGHREIPEHVAAPGENHEKPSTQRPQTGGVDHEGALRADERHPGGGRTGRVAQDVLQMGAQGSCRDAGIGRRPPGGPTPPGPRAPGICAGKTAGGDAPGKRNHAPAHGAKGYRHRVECPVRIGSDEKKMSR
jgi:transposase InsO family protein